MAHRFVGRQVIRFHILLSQPVRQDFENAEGDLRTFVGELREALAVDFKPRTPKSNQAPECSLVAFSCFAASLEG